MKTLILLLCGAVLGGMMWSATEVQAQNGEPDWGAFGLQLGLGITDAAIKAANRNNNNGWNNNNNGWNNNNRWNNQWPQQDYGAEPAMPAPGASGNDLFGRYNDPFQQQNNGWNRPNNNNNYRPSNNGWNQSNNSWNRSGYQYPTPRSSSSSGYYESVPVAPKVYSKKPIVIQCPSWCEGICQYSLISASGKEYVYSITPGEKQEFKETTDWKIKYDRGNGRGYKTYRLHGGKQYELHGDGDGEWAFYASP